MEKRLKKESPTQCPPPPPELTTNNQNEPVLPYSDVCSECSTIPPKAETKNWCPKQIPKMGTSKFIRSSKSTSLVNELGVLMPPSTTDIPDPERIIPAVLPDDTICWTDSWQAGKISENTPSRRILFAIRCEYCPPKSITEMSLEGAISL